MVPPKWLASCKEASSESLQMIQVILMGWHFCKEDSTARQPLAHESVIVNKLKKITPPTTKISASKFQNLSQIPLKIRGVWKNRGV